MLHTLIFNLIIMKVKTLSVAFALGIMGAIFMLVVTYYPILSESVMGMTKGGALRAIMEDIYPYYDHATWYAPLLGAAYGFTDAFFFGLITAWLYNGCLCGCRKCRDTEECYPKSKVKTVAKKAVTKKTSPKKKAPKKTVSKKRTTIRKKK